MRPKAMTWRDRLSNEKVVFWWFVGSVGVVGGLVVAVLAVTRTPDPVTIGESPSLWLIGGLFLSTLAYLAARLFLDVNRWRTRHKLTWSALLGLVFLGWIGWLVVTAPGWAPVRAALLILGYYAVLVGTGLLILYLAVRVVRVAWRTPASHVSLGAERDVIGHASAEAFQLILSPQEVWTLAAALATAVAPERTENLKGLRARLSILREVQQQWRTDAGRAVIARLGTKLLTLVEEVERLSTDV